jgi:hypothetical protein
MMQVSGQVYCSRYARSLSWILPILKAVEYCQPTLQQGVAIKGIAAYTAEARHRQRLGPSAKKGKTYRRRCRRLSRWPDGVIEGRVVVTVRRFSSELRS